MPSVPQIRLLSHFHLVSAFFISCRSWASAGSPSVFTAVTQTVCFLSATKTDCFYMAIRCLKMRSGISSMLKEAIKVSEEVKPSCCTEKHNEGGAHNLGRTETVKAATKLSALDMKSGILVQNFRA